MLPITMGVVCVNKTCNFFVHGLTRNQGFWGVARWQVYVNKQKVHVFALEDEGSVSAIRVNCCYRAMDGKGNLFADNDSGAACSVNC